MLIPTVNTSQVTNCSPQPPSMQLNSFSTCPYAESQPGQLLAVFECSDPDDTTEISFNISVMSLYEVETFYFRTVLLPSTDVDIVLQQDSRNPRWFYVLLEHVNFVTPDSTQVRAPTYHAYVQCTKAISTATHQQPIEFCIKHSQLTSLLTQSGNFNYNPATLFFSNIPRQLTAFVNPFHNDEQLLFKVRVGVFYVNVTSFQFVREENTHIQPYELRCQVYSLAGNSPFAMEYSDKFGEKMPCLVLLKLT